MSAIRTEKLTKRYGTTLALDALELAVEPGEVYGYLGPNGAGKTTTIRLLLGLHRPTAVGRSCSASTRGSTRLTRTGGLPTSRASRSYGAGRTALLRPRRALAFAIVPRPSSGLAYGLVAVTFVWELLGALLETPGWLLALSPFHDIGFVPGEPFEAAGPPSCSRSPRSRGSLPPGCSSAAT